MIIPDDAKFRQLCDTEKQRHKSVRLIHELAENSPEDRHVLLSDLGFPHANIIGWDGDDCLIYAEEKKSPLGGFVNTARFPGDEKLSTFVFLRCYDEEFDSTLKTCVLTAALMHEMGHVDDIEKGKNLRLGCKVDLVAAEVYANRYALRRMMKENLRFPLALLLSSLIGQSKFGNDNSVGKISARNIVESAEYRHYRKYIGDQIDVEALAPKS